jgi:PIN domain nuclease of toxin-antitoxin system
MTALLDTHTLVWSTLRSTKLSPRVTAIIEDPENRLLVSSVSAWEIATKVRLRKFNEAAPLEAAFLDLPSLTGFVFVDLTVETALLAGRLPGPHRDPFDRMIAAQALALNIPVISIDSKLDGFGISRIW